MCMYCNLNCTFVKPKAHLLSTFKGCCTISSVEDGNKNTGSNVVKDEGETQMN
jgi:hypothetical protein